MIIEPRTVKLTTRTGVEVRRSLPHAHLKRIGAWVFVDHFGPTAQTDGMVVAAHPHTGLQTVTWLFEGMVDHRDSIGSIQTITPGQLNLMTAGRGISHSELSMRGPENLHAVQLWVALPETHRHQAPYFEHLSNLPELLGENFQAKVLVGEFMGVQSAAKVFSELVGVEIRIAQGQKVSVPLREKFEYGILVANGEVQVVQGDSKELLSLNQLGYWEKGQQSLELLAKKDSILLLLGGVPMTEKIVMWWNFIERNHEEIVQAREQWNQRAERFGSFEDEVGGWIPAPELPNLVLQPR
ncbi:MAG: pirin family protein [Actinomycetota bacterium]